MFNFAARSTHIFHLNHALRDVEGKNALFKMLNLLISKCVYEKHFTVFVVYAAVFFVTQHLVSCKNMT